MSLGALKMLNVASWRKLRSWSSRPSRGLVPANLRLPNMRVQRTRAARFARIGSPLTRHPLGDPDA
jgi:hypothetical protein